MKDMNHEKHHEHGNMQEHPENGHANHHEQIRLQKVLTPKT
jgi:hypothetical protein